MDKTNTFDTTVTVIDRVPSAVVCFTGLESAQGGLSAGADPLSTGPFGGKRRLP